MKRPLLMLFIGCVFVWLSCQTTSAQAEKTFRVIGYFSGNTLPPDSFETNKLTHLIFCFCHLEGNRLAIANAGDSAIIQRMVNLKKKQPTLRVMLSLGGWGGCESCSRVFATKTGRNEFAASVKALSDFFHTDGIDLDWEYPTIQGYPGHQFHPADKNNFTMLLQALRTVNGETFEISFAAGGFTQYINEAIDWQAVTPLVDFINIMSYDLVHGFSTKSGHHTPLYSTPQQTESCDHAVQRLLKKGVPAHKLVIGAAFYGRFFAIAPNQKVELHASCKFSHAFSFKNASDSLAAEKGFIHYWDDIAQAPYAINNARRLVATFDDERSIALKTKYAVDKHLGGIMFWQLFDDKLHHGLLNVIDKNH